MFKKLFQKKPVEKPGLSKEEIAAMLRIHPEQLAKFEDTYTAILEKAELSDNLFDQNAKQSVRAKDVEELRKIPEEIVERIVLAPCESVADKSGKKIPADDRGEERRERE